MPKEIPDDAFAVLTMDGWKLLQAEFYKPLIRYQGREYQLERLVTSDDEGLMQIDLMTTQAAKTNEENIKQANKSK